MKSEEELQRFRKALRRFAAAITILNLLGHTVLGFEQSTLQPLVSLGTAYTLELLLALVSPGGPDRTRAFRNGWAGLVEYLLPAHITGLAVAMLLYANERLGVIAFASAVAIASKTLFRAPFGRGTRHFFNPSNFGIAVTLLCFPWMGVAPPYQFTEDVAGTWDWLVPMLILCTGSLLNLKLTRRGPLIAGWVGGFIAQAAVRHLLDGTQFAAAIMPMSGVAFVLFTFYMVTDPMTTPGENNPAGQVIFGVMVAAVYGLLVWNHIVFGMFFSLVIVCAARGLGLYLISWQERLRTTIPRLQPAVGEMGSGLPEVAFALKDPATGKGAFDGSTISGAIAK